MNISIIVCTYNRVDSLNRTLQSIKAMTVSDDIEWELLIVDNNSTDNTRKVVDEFISTSGLNCRYILEENQGHSHARNRGINESCGEIIAYTDDDVIVDKYWLQNIDNVFKENSISCVGGKILPIWEISCPEWLDNNHDFYGNLALLDYGDSPFYLDKPKIWGANFVVKKIMFEKYGTFNTSLGRIFGKLCSFDETDFLQRLIENGEKILYTPNLIVHHCIPAKRMRKSYFRKWRFDNSEMSALLKGPCHDRNIIGVPLYMIRQTFIIFFQWIFTLPLSWSRHFRKELELFDKVGFISGCLKVKWSRKYKL
ncbi:glycosyltransferases [Candidatus Scalindua japonica]|uniref:Glycosyltransferases n=1 Tax=Candidatus Scalindua japonica TaxID=1284222 RepID=A0A286U4B2_9BACT|nr:glycosyltransferase [Candidatus Scalindua japonica]GAX62979.1 glycosyltransferases [Candidatus Scalindua japonica]